ncbi:MAG: division/cell wall cluster transcriptional repressor MraZ [Chloroflexi bacterium]|nr:division/cell wall cluster transcriptional repressor MraZ [Chloroflexota bacterium]
MFMGEFEHTVDDKGRLAIPAKFRSRFADGLVVTRGLDGCLFVFTVLEWTALADKIAKLPMANPDARSFQRMMFSGATNCQLDQQGRFVLPTFLREKAGISNEAVIIGVNTRLEIWARERWNEMRDKVEEEGTFIAEHLAGLGI